jgi:hypothetical protein
MASYTIVTATAANVAGNTNTIASTKVKIVANAACVYAINAPATLTSNVGAMIPANFPTYINMTGIGNRIPGWVRKRIKNAVAPRYITL